MRDGLSFRARILLLVLAVGLLPLALSGLWLNRSAARSGRQLLRSRLDETVAAAASAIGARWVPQRSALLDLAESPFAAGVLSGVETPGNASGLAPNVVELDPPLRSVTLRTPGGEARWRALGPSPSGDVAGGSPLLLSLSFPIRGRGSEPLLGAMEVDLTIDELLGPPGAVASSPGMVLGAFQQETQTPLLPLPFESRLLREERFQWGGDTWLTSRRSLREPPIELVAAAPLAPFVRPFEDAARRGLWLLLGVTLVGSMLAAVLTGRLTHSLERLASAADRVAEGDLDQRVDLEGSDEVGRLARAFNSMTESLRGTLTRLSERESVAAVGEFAASLAHEIRNPLSAILVDLERVEESFPEESPLRSAHRRALRETRRLSDAVTGALVLARSGRLRREPVGLDGPIRSAGEAARPALERRSATLRLQPEGLASARVMGDADKLEQLFLNLILNAAQSLGEGGSIRVEVEWEASSVVVSVVDTGVGIPEEEIEKVFEPFYSTRSGGTGLGLPTSRRIARAHGGELEIESEVGRGTRARVRLPVLGESGADGE